MDRCDAPHASLGPFGLVADARSALVAGGFRGASFGSRRARLFRRLHAVARSDDLDDRDTWIAPARLVETNATHSGLGRGSVCHLADQFWTQQHSLARRGLSYPGWAPGAGGFSALRRLMYSTWEGYL